MTNKYILVGILLSVYTLTIARGNPGNSAIVWEDVEPNSNLLLRYPDPAGLEDGRNLVVCRSYEQDYWVPGKFWMDGGEYYCNVFRNFQAHKKTDFQVLEAPVGTTSWETVRGRLPENAIPAGLIWNGKTSYICRGILDNNLITGLFEEPYMCHVPRNGNEYMLTRNVEVLVVNAYGKIRGF